MRQIYLNKAIAEAVMIEMKRDEKVVLMGEDIVNRGGGMSTFLGVPQAFPDRSMDMPLAESGFTHFANGAALAGYRPVVDLMFSDFSAITMDAIVNGAAKFRFNSLGKISMPITYVMANGGRGVYDGVGSGCNHSQCVESWYSNVPGLKIVAPYYPVDILGLLRASIQDNDPVIFLYPEASIGLRGEIPDEDYVIPLNGAAKIMNEGSDVTLVAIQSMLPLAVKAVEELKKEGISVELIDPRVLIPFDEEKVINSVKKTGKLVIVHEGHKRAGYGSEIAAIMAEKCFESLKAPVKRVGALNAPIGSGYTEAYIMPHVEDIVKAVKEIA